MTHARALALVVACLVSGTIEELCAQDAGAEPTPQNEAPAAEEPAPPQMTMYIREYRVTGTQVLPPIEVEKAVYPFLGPLRTTDDVEQARQAAAWLRQAYPEAAQAHLTRWLRGREDFLRT